MLNLPKSIIPRMKGMTNAELKWMGVVISSSAVGQVDITRMQGFNKKSHSHNLGEFAKILHKWGYEGMYRVEGDVVVVEWKPDMYIGLVNKKQYFPLGMEFYMSLGHKQLLLWIFLQPYIYQLGRYGIGKMDIDGLREFMGGGSDNELFRIFRSLGDKIPRYERDKKYRHLIIWRAR
jgi:hypothetical protein